MEKIRQIEFRGKNNNNGEWVYGFLITSRERPGRTANFIIKDDGECNEPHEWILLKPETIGQYIGLKDKNGNKIFEGDIVKINPAEGLNGREYILSIFYNVNKLMYSVKGNIGSTGAHRSLSHWINNSFHVCEVIGNVYDNPELLEV